MGNEVFLVGGQSNGIHVTVVINIGIPLEHLIATRSGGGGSTFKYSVLVLIQPKGMAIISVIELEHIGTCGGCFEAGHKEGHVIGLFSITIKILDQSGTYVFGTSVVLGVSSKGITLNIQSLVGGDRP